MKHKLIVLLVASLLSSLALAHDDHEITAVAESVVTDGQHQANETSGDSEAHACGGAESAEPQQTAD
ncbi:hypothetical protein [Pantoea sp. B65]|uniref:hypothetical protein n=1 Tax=Pantoea sp. B65 TaxID=2813359 RepID=UPI0039B6DDB6